MSAVVIDPSDVALVEILGAEKGLPVSFQYVKDGENEAVLRQGKVEGYRNGVLTLADADGFAGKFRGFRLRNIMGCIIAGG